jgi:hypothetical protein
MRNLFITFLLISFLILIGFFFNEQIIKFSLEKIFSKWIKRDVEIGIVETDIQNNYIIIKNIEIINQKKSQIKNIFKIEKIIFDLNVKKIFERKIYFNLISIENSNFVFEINRIKNNMYEDNINIIEKISSNKPDKIWPKKLIDINFEIKNLYIKDLNVELITNLTNQRYVTYLESIQFENIGNSKDITHYKDGIKILANLIFLKIPDNELRSNLFSLYGLD